LWLDLDDSNSLATWIIFYLETALWAHYLAYVRNELPVSEPLFVPRENQYINLKNEISAYWEQIQQNEDILESIATEIAKRSPPTRRIVPSTYGHSFYLNVDSQEASQRIM